MPGKIYANEGNVRAYPALIAAKFTGAALELAKVEAGSAPAELKAKFPLGKLPALVDGDVTLFESNAIAYYAAASKADGGLLGKDAKETAQVMQYLSLAESEIMPVQAAWTYPILGWIPQNKGASTKAAEDAKRILGYLNDVLLSRTYLVGESVTLADITVFSALLNLFKLVLDPAARAPYANLTRWFTTIAGQDEVSAVVGEVALAEVVAEPKKEEKKKEEKPKEEKKAEKKKEEKPKEPEDDEDDEPAPVKKAPNPMDLLPPSTFNLDAWKRQYSNSDVRPDSVNYFWKEFDPQGYSMWRADYKYNDELTQVFMSSNLIGGFFQRLESCRKYAFGTLCVFGEDGKNEIHGYFIIRGQEIPEILKEVPDYESYDFTKVDPADPAVKKNWEDYIAWDGDLEGMKFADGKIFK